MMVPKVTNNARGYLASAISAADTQIALTSGTGASFPTLTSGDTFNATLVSVTGAFEIVTATARAGDVLTLVRGAEGTTPSAFAAGSLVELRVTAAVIDSVVSQLNDIPAQVTAQITAATADTQRTSELFREFRPGDAPTYFNLSGGGLATGLNGKVYRFTGAGLASMKNSVPLEVGQTYTFRLGYQRFKDSGDPANDGITAGIEWYNGFGNKIGETVVHADNTLLVSSLRREFSYSVGFGGGEVMDVYIPSSARYVIVWYRTFGAGHQTDLDTLYFARSDLPTPLVVSASDIVIPTDFQWPAGTIPDGAGVSDPYTVARTFYVTMDGSDASDGTSLSSPKATIGSALAAAAAVGQPCGVIVHPGEYTVQPDTVIPENCALYGYDLRVTKVRLPNGLEQNNMFQLSSGCKARGLTFSGLQHESPPSYASTAAGLAAVDVWDYFTVSGTLYRNLDGVATLVEHDYPPKKGWAFVFKPGAFITRSPYISDCSQLHAFTQDQMTLPIDREAGNPLMPRGGGNLLADGSVLAPSSPLRSVVVDSFTAINPNGYGYLMARNAFVQLVSVFTNWSRYGLWCHDGGQVTVANSNSTFGDYALVATGFRYTIRIPDPVGQPRGVYIATADAITEQRDIIVGEMYAQLADEFVVVQNFTQEQEELTRRDARTLLRELADDFRSGQDRGSQFFVKGLFNWNAEYFFDPTLLPIFLRSFDIIEERILARCSLTSPAEDMLGSLISLIKTNVETPPVLAFPSVVEATGQQFSYVGSGVNYNSLPYSQRGTGLAGDPAQVNLKRDGGRIYATFSTELGDTYLGEDLRVDFERGTVEGQAFSRGVQNITLPLIQALGG
jgi:hypothetical protein